MTQKIRITHGLGDAKDNLKITNSMDTDEVYIGPGSSMDIYVYESKSLCLEKPTENDPEVIAYVIQLLETDDSVGVILTHADNSMVIMKEINEVVSGVIGFGDTLHIDEFKESESGVSTNDDQNEKDNENE